MSFLKAGNLNFIRSRPFPTLWSTGYYSVLAFKKFIQQEIHPIKMSVYNFLKSKVSEHATKKSPDALERGKMYEVYLFKQQVSSYKDKNNECPNTLMAYFKDGRTKYFVTLPGLYNNMSEEHVAQLNEDIGKKVPPSIVFYGKDENRNDILIHPFGEEVDQERLREMKEKEESTPKKRKLESE